MSEAAASMTPAEYRRMVLAAFDDQLKRAVRDGTDIGGLPAPITAARAAVESLTTRHYFDTQAGPFYTSGTVRGLLGISRQAVSDRIRHHRLLRMVTTDRVHVFPAFQFIGDTVDSRLVPALQILLKTGESGWTVASWLTAPMTPLDGMTPVEALRSGRTDLTHRVHALAEESASRWAA